MKNFFLSFLYLITLPLFSQETNEEVIPFSYDTSGYLENNPDQNSKFKTPSYLLASDEVIPTINAEMDVNESGALIYTLPIEVFQGISNFQPNISLSYNSQSGNGHAGWGWNIQGISLITQGGTSKEIDGITRGAQFSSSDPFYLDGQRLITTFRNQYETQLFSKLRISRYTENGYSFVVKYPDGKIGKYKELVDGQHYITTFIDALGNEIHYDYTVNVGVPYIKSISYGGTNTNSDTYKIEFSFETRTYPIKSYKNGNEFINNKILSQVIVSSTYDGIYRKYLLQYDRMSDNQERLRRIEVENGKGEKLKPLALGYNTTKAANLNKIDKINKGFVYNDVKSLGNVAIGDFLGTGKPFPIYNMETKEGYKILDSERGIPLDISSDNDTQLFSGKALLKNGAISENDQLIIVNTEFIKNSSKYDLISEEIPFGSVIGGIEVKNMKGHSTSSPPRTLKIYTPKIKVSISVYDPKSKSTQNVYFYAKGNYFGTIEEKCEKHTYSWACEEKLESPYYEKNQISKDLGKQRVTVADFNNDGLTDILIQNKPSSCSKKAGGPIFSYAYPGYREKNSYINQCFERESTFYFIEIGKLQQQGEITPEIFSSEANHLGTPIEFDGDGIPELIYSAFDQYHYERDSNPSISVLKVNTLEKSIKKIPSSSTNVLITHNDYKEPVFYGDFNGDGLTDFMIPRKVFELSSKKNANQVMNEIDSSPLLWDLYTGTGKEFIRKEMDFTEQRLAYLKPSRKNIIKKSSFWQKFWSGKPDEFKHAEYGTSYLIPTDFDNDGKTDLILIRKFTKLKQATEDLNSMNVENLTVDSSNGNIVSFHQTITDTEGNLNMKRLDTRISLQDNTISPISLLMGNTDYNQLNTYKSGVTIYDPITKKSLKIEVDNDKFTERFLKEVDNGSGVTQNIEYRPMINHANTPVEKIYTTSGTSFAYPYYVHQTQGAQYLVHKLNTIFDKKALTKEYRYEDGIQHLEGKGFIGFRKTFVSDPYESEIEFSSPKAISLPNVIRHKLFREINGHYMLTSSSHIINSHLNFKAQNIRLLPGFKASSEEGVIFRAYVDEINKNTNYLTPISSRKKDIIDVPVFWTIHTYDPLKDHSLITTTYGSLDEKSVFTKNSVTYTRYDKANHRYLYLPVNEENQDYLKKVRSLKNYIYYPETLYLKEATTQIEDGFSSSQTSRYTYTPNFSNGAHIFSGKIQKTEEIVSRGGDQFSTQTESFYNSSGLLTLSKKYGNNTDPIHTEYAYDNYGNVLSETIYTKGVSPLTTQYEYDDTHRYVVKAISPEGLAETLAINTLGQIMSETSALGLTSHYQYDSWNNISESTNYLGIKTKISKKALNEGKYELSTETEGESPVIAIFDKFDRKIQSRTLSLGKWVYTDTEYDIFGKEIRTSEAHFEGDIPLWNTTEYDDLQRPIKLTLFTGKVINTCYEGLKVTVEDGHRKVSKTLDASGHIIEHNDSGGKITYTYYPNGTVKEANYDGIILRNEQDGWGNKTKTIDPSAGTYEYEYDNLGRLLKETTPKGSTSYTYDVYGKVLNETIQGDHTSIYKTYTYDDTSKLPIKITGQSNGKSYSYETFYDSYYRITGKREVTPYLISESKTTFDSKGRTDKVLMKTQIPEISYSTSSQLQNQYNGYGELIRQLDTDTGALIWELLEANAQGQVTKSKYGNGYSLSNRYNPQHYLENSTQQKGNLTAVNTDFDYDILRGTLTRRNTHVFNKNESFEYDDIDRLLKEKLNEIIQKEYTYDKRGRMTYNSQVGAYEYPEYNYQLHKITFNTEGTQLKQKRGFHEITYNTFKNPVEIYLAGKDHIQYEYGILKNRSASFYGNTEPDTGAKPNRNYYTFDGSVEVVKTGTTYKIITYINGDAYSANYIKIEQLSNSTLTGSKKYFLHRDNLQSIVAITDAQTGEIAEQRFFDAWGNLTEVRRANLKTQTSNFLLLINRGYTGHEHLLSVGLIHMNGRLYDPELRRFLSPDNFVQDPYNTQNYNRYGYVLNNPLLYTDPSGEFFISLAISVGIGILSNSINNIINGVPFWYGTGKAAVMSAVTFTIGYGIGAAQSAIFNSPQTSGVMSLSEAGYAMFGNILGKYLPKWSVKSGDLSLSLNSVVLLGKGFGLGANLEISYQAGNFNFSYGFGITYFKKYYATGNKGWETRNSFMVGWDDGKTGFSLASNIWWSNVGNKDDIYWDPWQRTGKVGLHFGDFNATYENDGMPFNMGTKKHGFPWLGDGGDSYRTASVTASIGDYGVGFNLFTGKRKDYSDDKANVGKMDYSLGRRFPNGFVKEEGPRYRMGALYFSYKGYRVGTDSEHVRHAIQDQATHNFLGEKQPGFILTSWDWKPYSQYRTPNKFTSW